jgi:hypothetical protein
LSTDNQETEERRICSDCVGEAFLRAEIHKRGNTGACSYCGGEEKTFSIGEMADVIKTALHEHYYHTPSEPDEFEYAMQKHTDYDWEREGYPIVDVIADCADITSKCAEDIRSVLAERYSDTEESQWDEEDPFDEDAYYAERSVDHAESQASWRRFEESLTTESRYFNQVAQATLASVFEGLGQHKTADGKPVIVEAGPNTQLTAFYRARVFQSHDKLEEALKRPDQEIGPPPPFAAISGRMNPHGIAVFYGALDPAIAIAEVRPPVGSKVVVGRFDLIRMVRLLDLEALKSVNVEGSIFDPEHIGRLERAKFLNWLSDEITQPVMPNDEPFGYLATQAIADFLATVAEPSLDGILYSSVQGSVPNMNVVLFHKASRLEGLDIPEGTDISATLTRSTEEGEEIDYSVFERVPQVVADQQPTFVAGIPLTMNASGPPEYDSRETTLRLVVESLEVHHITGVTFQSEQHHVDRYRYEKDKL